MLPVLPSNFGSEVLIADIAIYCTISNNYLAIIIIDKNKNKLMTKGYVPI